MLDSVVNGMLKIAIAGLLALGFAFALQLVYDAAGKIVKGVRCMVRKVKK